MKLDCLNFGNFINIDKPEETITRYKCPVCFKRINIKKGKKYIKNSSEEFELSEINNKRIFEDLDKDEDYYVKIQGYKFSFLETYKIEEDHFELVLHYNADNSYRKRNKNKSPKKRLYTHLMVIEKMNMSGNKNCVGRKYHFRKI